MTMFKRFSTNYMAALFLADIIAIQIALWVAMQLRFVLPFGQDVRVEWVPIWVYTPGWQLHLAVGVLWVISFLVLSVYTARRIVRWLDETQRILLAHTISALSLAGLLYLTKTELPRLTYLYFYGLSLILLLGYRALLRAWHRTRHHRSGSVARILVVGAGDVGGRLVAEFHRQQWPGIDFVGFLDDSEQKQGKHFFELPVLGRLGDAIQIIQREAIDEVIVTLPAHAHNQLANLVALLYEQPIRVRVVPDYFGLAFFGATVESLGGIPLIGLRDPAIDDFQRFAKRLLDIFLSSVGLLLASPLLAAVAVAIKLEDGGPIFYRAARVGENGQIFHMLKFRSMIRGADKIQQQVNQMDANGKLIHKVADDPRITRIGRLIRRTSIDELPQLVNVLRGEMSLVGPRPELPWLVETYEPWQRKRFAVPQGITGWWQVNGRSDNAMHLHTDQDIYYIQNYSLWLDLQILWRTVTIVLRGKGAY
jgi:exopolysaccharide biosynthesis polyprenyl glycosylphosphotransferase